MTNSKDTGEQGVSDSPSESTTASGKQVVTPSEDNILLTSWCGGMGCDNCKLCLILSGKAKLIKADERNLTFTYKIIG